MAKKINWLALLKDPDVIFQLAVLGCCIFLSIDTRTYLAETRTFPQILLYCISLLSGMCLFFKFFLPNLLPYIVAPRQDEEDEEVAIAKKLTASRFYLGCVGIVLAAAAHILLGFIFIVPVYFIFYALFLGNKKNLLKVTVTALCTAVVIYVIFGYFLNLPMTKGLLIS